MKKKNTIVMILAIFFIFFTITNAMAQEAPEKKEVKEEKKKDEIKWYDKLSVSGEVFLNYNYHSKVKDKDSNKNSFNVNRAYINFKGKINDKLKYRVTTDIMNKDQNDDHAKYSYLKYAYGTFQPFKFVNFTFGQQATHWCGYADKIGGLRIVEKNLLDKNKIASSADVGFAIHSGTKKKDRVAGILDYWVGIFNGENYKNFEEQPLKDFAIRLGLAPIDNDSMKIGFATGLYVHHDINTETIGTVTDPNTNITTDITEDHGTRTNTISGLAYFTMKKLFHFQAETFYAITQEDTENNNFHKTRSDSPDDIKNMGISLLGKFHAVPDLLDVFARFDYVKPNSEVEVVKNYLIGGINYKLDKKGFWIVPNVKYDWYSGDDTNDIKQENLSMNVDVLVKF